MKIDPNKIREIYKSTPPYQVQDVMKSYINQEIQWNVLFKSISSKTDEGGLHLFLVYHDEKEYIFCDIQEKDFPLIKIFPKDTPLVLRGTISNIGPLSIEITKAQLLVVKDFDLGRAGEKKFMTSKGLEGQKIGIIGLGRIGQEIAKMLQPFKTGSISYFSKNQKDILGINYLELSDLLKGSDVIFLCVSNDAGEGFVGEKELAQMKDGALLVSFTHPGVIDEGALLGELKSGRIRAVSDYPMTDQGFKDLPMSSWHCFNSSNAFNTFAGLKLTSDMATKSIINLLATGEDENRVNNPVLK